MVTGTDNRKWFVVTKEFNEELATTVFRRMHGWKQVVLETDYVMRIDAVQD